MSLKQDILNYSTNTSNLNTTIKSTLTRPNVNVRDVGSNLGKSLKDLKDESHALDSLLASTEQEISQLQNTLNDRLVAVKECVGIANYTCNLLEEALEEAQKDDGYSLVDCRSGMIS